MWCIYLPRKEKTLALEIGKNLRRRSKHLLQRVFLKGKMLLISLTIKMNVFLVEFISIGRACDIIVTRWPFSLSSCLQEMTSEDPSYC